MPAVFSRRLAWIHRWMGPASLRFGPRALPPGRATHPLPSGTPALILALLCVLPLSCAESPPVRPNIILVVIDTLRFDHVGSYGSERRTTPALDSLAAAGLRFERAYATAPWTTPSIASIITGRFPVSHGATQLDSKLPLEALTMAEILKSDGYATSGVASHILISSKRDFDQGFDTYRHVILRDHHSALTTKGVTTQGRKLLREMAAGAKPFFLFLHYFDPHYNYIRHPEYGFAAESCGRLNGEEDVESLRSIESTLTRDEFDFLASIYDEEIRHTDAGLGRLLGELRALGLEDQTLVIVTGDHGEEFGEHAGLGHSRTLYEEVMRVPLVMAGPGISRSRPVRRPVSLVSTLPTLLDLAHVPGDTLTFHGPSLASLVHNPGSAAVPGDNVIFFEVDYEEFNARQKGIIKDGIKLIVDEQAGRFELYDLESDPMESQDLAASRPDLLRGLIPVLGQYIHLSRSDNLPTNSATLSPEELERLRSLGYVR